MGANDAQGRRAYGMGHQSSQGLSSASQLSFTYQQFEQAISNTRCEVRDSGTGLNKEICMWIGSRRNEVYRVRG